MGSELPRYALRSPKRFKRGTLSTSTGVRAGWGLSFLAMPRSPTRVRGGTFSAPAGVRVGWGLSSIAMRLVLPDEAGQARTQPECQPDAGQQAECRRSAARMKVSAGRLQAERKPTASRVHAARKPSAGRAQAECKLGPCRVQKARRPNAGRTQAESRPAQTARTQPECKSSAGLTQAECTQTSC